MIVAHTNLIASFWVPSNMEQLAYRSLKKDPEWIAPLLWASEFRNVLSLYYIIVKRFWIYPPFFRPLMKP